MKLSKLYTNWPDRFTPIHFHEGVNVILAEIRLPENKTKDTHNLGKSTIGRLLDFTLLSSVKKQEKFFLFQEAGLFHEWVLFLEIQLDPDNCLTIRRAVASPTKISFHRHTAANQDWSQLPMRSWDHQNLAFEKAKILLDGVLNIEAVKPRTYRTLMGYLLRKQADYQSVFQLSKMMKGKEAVWRTAMAKLLGFNTPLIELLYEKKDALEAKKKEESAAKKALGYPVHDISQIEGMLLLKSQEAMRKQGFLIYRIFVNT